MYNFSNAIKNDMIYYIKKQMRNSMEEVNIVYNALTIAQYIINKCFIEGSPVTNLRLQKLLYFVQGQVLRYLNRPLFNDDFYAWAYGPVIPEIYFEFCGYAGAPIRRTYDNIEIDLLESTIIDDTISRLAPYDDWQLVKISHEKGAPWDKHKYSRERIPKKEIKKFFNSLG